MPPKRKSEIRSDLMPYDRQPRETDKTWEPFIIYRDLGTNRTFKKVAEIYKRNNSYITSTIESLVVMFSGYSRKWNWRERVAAWDNELDRINRARQIKEIQRMRERHTQLSLGIQNIVTSELKKLTKLSAENPDVVLDFSVVLKALETAVKLERMSRGEPDTIIEERKEITTEEKKAILGKMVMDEETLDRLDKLIEKHAAK